MPVNLVLEPVLPVAGVALAAVAAGIRTDGRDDLLLVRLAEGSRTVAVLTRNAFAAAPVLVCREHLTASGGAVRALLVNAGNANAGTGEEGLAMTRAHCAVVADALGVASETVLPYSTGVIGQLLPDGRMRAGIGRAATMLGDDGDTTGRGAWERAARAIMTTDTLPKASSRVVALGNGDRLTLSGFVKGAGMIEPHMATMLAYLFTDAAIGRDDLRRALEDAVADSFNAISVDGDTSTNDACTLVATGQGTALSASLGDDWQTFTDALGALARDLAQAIVRDAEGATKFVTVRVREGRDRAECRAVAYAIARSPLVKTALFASDANVGRLLMAIGNAGVAALDPAAVSVALGDVPVFERGGVAAGYSEARGAAVMAEEEILVDVALGRGKAAAEVWTSDLSHDYVSINADYRT